MLINIFRFFLLSVMSFFFFFFSFFLHYLVHGNGRLLVKLLIYLVLVKPDIF